MPRECHGQRSLAGCSPWGHKELDMTEQLLNNDTYSVSLIQSYLLDFYRMHKMDSFPALQEHIVFCCCCCCCCVASVVSDSMRPRRVRQPTRLPHPWDSPGKNTGVGCHFLLQCMKVESESEFAQSCPTLSDPMDCNLPGFSIHGIFQARVLEWGAIAFSDIVF